MATKWKIILGFGFMILMLICVGWLGKHSLDESTERFEEFRVLAAFSVDAGDAEVELDTALVEIYEYILTADDTTLKNATVLLDSLEKRLEAGSKYADQKETIDLYARLKENIAAFRKHQQEVDVNLKALYNEYNTTMTDDLNAMAKQLETFAEGSAVAGNVEALRLSARTWKQLGPLMASMGRYVYSRFEDETAARALIAGLGTELDAMRGVSFSTQGRELHGGLMKAYNNLKASFERVNDYGAKLGGAIEGLHVVEDKIAEDLGKISDTADRLMASLGKAAAEEAVATERMMLIGSIGGIIGGVAIAAFIALGIIRVLTDLAAYAGSVSRGDFSQNIRSREGGEIGTMISAMRRIPEELGNIINTAGTLSADIRLGRLRERLHVKDFPGAFGELALAVNTVGDAYTQVIDDIPLPVMAADKSCNIIFFNRRAQGVVGGNLVNKSCSDVLNAESCGTPNCFGVRAMKADSSCEGETVLRINDKEFIVSVTAVPLHDAQNKPAGFIEILADLTAIRGQERLIMQVADEAAEIAGRVAAASEELAAQVEQVSRGAEMQRERVDSTASAMTEMNATVLEVARSAGEASEQSEGTREKAQEGAELVNQVMTAINAVNQVGQNLQGNMQELGKQAESIGSVMNVISDIADQTNLLALNAAIEAARAGEAGRGFAVVADEVRKLAEKTMEATQEVGSSIRAVQQSARVNIDEVSKAVASVAEANSLADSSGSALAEIVHLASANSAVVASIATAAEEQSATSEEINRAIDEINLVVGETSEGMVQSTSAIQDLSHTAQELRRVMDRLKR